MALDNLTLLKVDLGGDENSETAEPVTEEPDEPDEESGGGLPVRGLAVAVGVLAALGLALRYYLRGGEDLEPPVEPEFERAESDA